MNARCQVSSLRISPLGSAIDTRHSYRPASSGNGPTLIDRGGKAIGVPSGIPGGRPALKRPFNDKLLRSRWTRELYPSTVLVQQFELPPELAVALLPSNLKEHHDRHGRGRGQRHRPARAKNVGLAVLPISLSGVSEQDVDAH